MGKLTRREMQILRLIVEDHIGSEIESDGEGIETAKGILAKLATTVQAATPQVKPLTWALWWSQDQGHREYAVTPYGMEYHVSDEGWWFPLCQLHPCDGMAESKKAAYEYHAKVVQECIG